MKSPGSTFLLTSFMAWAFLFCTTSAMAQQLWGEVRLNKSSVYVGEPVEVTVSVFTSTWFTAGVDPGNIKVEGAYTVFFRNVSTSRQQGGQTFSGVEMIFNVFPSSSENITFPSIHIEVETPPEGGYEGVKRTVKTEERIIKVRPIPPGFSQEDWLVSGNVSVRQNWSGDLKKVKVGDVITRTITRTVSNTVSQLIPPVAWDSISGVSTYPSRGSVKSNRNKTAISASRTESMRYLFEKEGQVVFPEMEFTWWNPYQRRLLKRTLPEVKIEVQPNPDLGMLASIRDSLQAQMSQVEEAAAEEEKPITVLGMSLKRFASLVLAIVLLSIAFIMLIRWGVGYRKKYLLRYRNSELYYWRKFVWAAGRNNYKQTTSALYRWIDALHLPQPTASYFARYYGGGALQEEVSELEKKSANKQAYRINVKYWKEARDKYLQKSKISSGTVSWINP